MTQNQATEPKNYAILDEEGVVTNIVVAFPDWVPPEGQTKLEATSGCIIGASWVNNSWVVPEHTTPVPQSISPLQARRALRAAGLLSTVQAFIETQTEEVQEAWEYCVEVRRDDTLITNAQAALGLTNEQVDDLFRLGASLA